MLQGEPTTVFYPDLTRRFDGSTVLGYLNFSDGRADARFRKSLADAFGFLTESGDATPWVTIPGWLQHRAGELEQSGSAAFRDTAQARQILDRSRQFYVVMPFAVELPGEDQPPRRFPDGDASPIALRSVDAHFITTAAGARLQDRSLCGLRSDVVGLQRPPQSEFFCKHTKHVRLWRVDDDALPHHHFGLRSADGFSCCHGFLLVFVFFDAR